MSRTNYLVVNKGMLFGVVSAHRWLVAAWWSAMRQPKGSNLFIFARLSYYRWESLDGLTATFDSKEPKPGDHAKLVVRKPPLTLN